MSKKRKKTKKINKNKTKAVESWCTNYNGENKYVQENTTIKFCQKQSCTKEWNNVIEMTNAINQKVFFCFKHADEFEEKLPTISKDKLINWGIKLDNHEK